MLLIPAIDLKDGTVVRLTQGRFRQIKTYSTDPLKTALHWVRQGASFLHLVDLDGARTGKLVNLAIISRIAKSVPVPVECGGGVRTRLAVEKLLAAGVSRVVLGTRAIEDAAFLKDMLSRFGDKIIVSLDAKNGRLAVRGWQEETAASVVLIPFARRLAGFGLRQVIYTDILKDGTMTGPNIKALSQLARETGLEVIASGGISSLKDIARICKLSGQGVTAMIIGKALYEGAFTLKEALSIVRKEA